MVRNQPVDVISVCSACGDIRPLRLRMEDEQHQLLRVDIEEIISMKPVQFVGIEAQIFLCKAMVKGNDHVTWLTQMLCGIFMTITIISPLKDIVVRDWSSWAESLSLEADAAVGQGSAAMEDALNQSIRNQVEAYILDKSQQLGAALTVSVQLSQDPIPVPVSVTVFGDVSPYAKSQLQRILSEDLGISKEDQHWN